MFNENKGNGYDGFSMSNNARAAYENNEMPKSKWTKSVILEILELEAPGLVAKAGKLPAYVLKQYLKKRTSWHHTSKHYNKTNFYSFDVDKFESASPEDFDEIIAQYKRGKDEKPASERWLVAYTEWEKLSRFGRPKPIQYRKEGTILGNIFTADDGTRKLTTGKSFRKIERLS